MTRASHITGRKTAAATPEDLPVAADLLDTLASSPTHPHGIKIMLEDGQVSRVKEVLESCQIKQRELAQIEEIWYN